MPQNTGYPPRRPHRRRRRPPPPPPWITLYLCNHPLENQVNTCPWDGVKTKQHFLAGAPRAEFEAKVLLFLHADEACNMRAFVRPDGGDF